MSAEVVRAAVKGDSPRIASIYVAASMAALGSAANPAGIEAAAGGAHALWAPLVRPTPTGWLLVLDRDGVRAFVSFGFSEPRSDPVAHLYALYVDPEQWGCGHGSRLLDRAATTLAAARVTAWELWVQEENRRARDFYSRRGWSPTGEQRTNERGTFLLYASELKP